MSTINNNNELKIELEAFPAISGKIRDAVYAESGDKDLVNAAQRAVWAMSYVSAFSQNGLGDYLASFGAKLTGKNLDTEGRLDIETTKIMTSAHLNIMTSWSVGPRDENKQIMLLPGETSWMHILLQDGVVVRSRKATAEDFANAPAFAITSPALATKVWHRVGALYADWATRHEAGQELTAALPEIPVKAAAVKAGKNNSKGRNRGRRGTPKGKR